MLDHSAFETQQVRAYAIAEADGFREHPDVYWLKADITPTPKAKDKLTVIEGIGPKISALLVDNGILSFADLAKTKIGTLKDILKSGGPRYTRHKPNSWPKQARLARDGKMDALKLLQDELHGGV